MTKHLEAYYANPKLKHHLTHWQRTSSCEQLSSPIQQGQVSAMTWCISAGACEQTQESLATFQEESAYDDPSGDSTHAWKHCTALAWCLPCEDAWPIPQHELETHPWPIHSHDQHESHPTHFHCRITVLPTASSGENPQQWLCPVPGRQPL